MSAYRFITCLTVLLWGLLSHAQTCSVIFEGNNFKIQLNKIKQQQDFQNIVRFENLKSREQYEVRVSFKNDSTTFTERLFLLEDGFVHTYQVTKNKLQFKKAIPQTTDELNADILTYQYRRSGEELLVQDMPDTTLSNSSSTPQFESYYKLDDYSGKLGCPFPIKENELSELKNVISKQALEDGKLEKVKEAIFSLDSACLMVEQTKALLVLFEYEETKLDFAKFMYQHTFDLENYGKLNEVFQFENSKEELELFIKNSDAIEE